MSTSTHTAISITEASYSVTVTVARLRRQLRHVWPCLSCHTLTPIAPHLYEELRSAQQLGIICPTCLGAPPPTEAFLLVRGAA